MSKVSHGEKVSRSRELAACACSQVRRTARKVSMIYDHALASAGLTVSQYSVLANVGQAGTIGRTQLAAILGMDRTTLTRTLGPLERAELIVKACSQDRRERLLRLSPEGRLKLAESHALWEEVQDHFLRTIGFETFNDLQKGLESAERAADSILSRSS